MDMARRRIDLRLEEDFLARVDAEAERLGQTRTKFVERALESALRSEFAAGPASPDRVPRTETVVPSASTRASDDVEALKAVHRDFAKSVSRDAMVRQRRLNEEKS